MTGTYLPALTGSLSTPAGENPTVEIVEAAYRHHGIHARYINCEVSAADLGDAVRGVWALGWVGFNCSLPHKVTVIEHLAGLAESASVIGAVNCAVRTPEGFIGENTDGKGFLESLRGVVDPAGTSAVVFGAGGAARACAVEMALAGVSRITLVNRGVERGTELVALLNERTPAEATFVPWSGAYRIPTGTDIVLNATSIGFGSATDLPEIDVDSLGPGMVVADVIANPARTHLIRTAAERGCTVLPGRGMLINQAVLGIRLWTGVDVDPAVMLEALDELDD